MDKHVMHNIIHREYGDEASRCPVCTGVLSKDDAITRECNAILQKQQTMNMLWSEQKGIKKGDSGVKIQPFFQFSEGGDLPTEIQLVPIGSWNTTKYGEVTLTKEDIAQFKKNFDNNTRKGVMIDIDHGSSQHGQAAAGWIKKVEARADGLWATEIDWTPLGEEMVKGQIYKFLSPEFDTIYVNPQDANDIKENVLIATSLVNRPLLKEIPALSFSETKKEDNDEAEKEKLTKNNAGVILFTETMNKDQILAKKKEDRTSEEVAFLEANKETFSEEQKAAYAAETATPVKEEAATPTGTPEVKVEATEKTKTISMSEDEVKTLKEQAAAGQVAFKAMEKSELTNTYNTMTFGEAGGKIPTATVDPAVKLALTLNAEQRKMFDDVLATLPDRKMFGEIGNDETITPNQQANALNADVEAYAKENKVTFSEALKTMQAADPKKFSEYTSNLTPVQKV